MDAMEDDRSGCLGPDRDDRPGNPRNMAQLEAVLARWLHR